jgi:uncharacterized membrane-anchored protein YitT (DUF2179 family)
MAARMDASTNDITTDKVRHTMLDDTHALFIGVMFCGVGLYLLRQSMLVTGGMAGVALLLSYVTALPSGWLFIALNIPFLYFAKRALGTAFAVKTLIATLAVGWLASFLPMWMTLSRLDPVFCALFSGVLLGMGLLALARHRSSVGGIGILALYLQERRGWRAGYVQLAFDCVILLVSLFLFDLRTVGLSVLTAGTMNLVLAFNHKPGRYAGY